MKKYVSVNEVFRVLLWIVVSSVFLFISCNNVGLGDSVDTEAPTLSISYPPSSAIIRGTFTLAGSCTDDEGVTSVKVSVTNTDTSVSYGTHAATVNSTKNGWSISLNAANPDGEYNGWTFPDGKYVVNATAYDDAGRSSGVSSRTFEIDNTAPVFIIKSPGSVSIESPTAYGSSFKVNGTIADDHTIKTMAVTVYDTNNKEIGTYTSSNVETAGGTSVVIAKYLDGGTDELNDRYTAIYGAGKTSSSTRAYYCTITLTDSARQYTNSSSDSTTGNATTTCYLNDDVYDTLMDSSKGYGLEASDIKKIVNGTYTGSIDTTAVTELLSKFARKKTAFSLNPDASPKYTVMGYSFTGTDVGDLVATSNQKMTVVATAGRNGTYIKPSTLKVYQFGPYDSLDSGIISEVYTNPESYANANKDLTQIIADNSDYSSGTVESYSYGIDLYKTIVANKYYILAATGRDVDDVDLESTSYYGFKGYVSGLPPTITWPERTDNSHTNIADLGVFNSSEMSFSGTASSSASTINNVMYSITVTDESSSGGNSTVGTITGSATAGDGTFDSSSESWSFDVTKGTGYAACAALADSGKEYLYSLTVKVVDANGNTVEKLRRIHVDTTKPLVAITSIVPTVSENSQTYVNGTVTMSGTISETNLADVTKEVFVNGESKGSTDLGAVYSFTQSVDTTQYTDGKSFKVLVTATDKAGNTETYSTATYNGGTDLIIKQSTDEPEIKLSNADGSLMKTSGITTSKNLFGTVSNNKLLGTITDDDGIKTVTVGYRTAGSTGDYTITSILTNGTSTTYALSYTLPSVEGQYEIQLAVTDTKSATSYSSVENTFVVGVDSGAPTLSITTESGAYQAANADLAVKGTAVDSGGIASLYRYSSATATESAKESSLINIASGGTWTDTIPASTVGEKGATKYYVATDVYGQSTTVAFLYKIDALAPTFTITKLGSTSLSGTDILGGGSSTSVTEYAIQSNVYQIKGTISDSGDSGVEGMYYYLGTSSPAENSAKTAYTLDNSGWTVCPIVTSGGTSTWTANIDLSGSDGSGTAIVADTTYGVYLAAKDGAGNVSLIIANPCAKISVVPDNDSPDTTVTASDQLYDANGNAVTGISFGSTYLSKAGFTLSGIITEKHLDTAVLSVTKDGTSVSGASLTRTDKDWTYAQSAASDHSDDGKYVYTITLTDLAGRTTDKSITVYVDTTAPALTIVSPASGESILTSSALLSGTVTDDGAGVSSSDGVQYTVTNTSADPVTGNATVTGGSWQTSAVSFGSEGTLSLTVTAEDKLGHTTVKTVSFYYDKAKPVLSETKVGVDGLTTNGNFVLSGTASDTNALAATSPVTITDSVNGTVSSATYTPSVSTDTMNKGAWSQSFTVGSGGLADGTHTFTITATDVAGKTTSVSRTVKIDTSAPVIGGSSFADTLVKLDESPYDNLTVTAADDGIGATGLAGVYYAVADTAPSFTAASESGWTSLAQGSSGWTGTVNFSGKTDGTCKVYTAAKDNAGNRVVSSGITVTIDTAKPVIAVSTPSETSGTYYVARSGSFTLSGSVTDTFGIAASGVTVTATKAGSAMSSGYTFTTAKDSTVTSGGKVAFTLNISAGTEGTNDGTWKFAVTGTDSNGRPSTSATYTVLVDATLPVVASGAIPSEHIFGKSESAYSINGTYTETNLKGIYYYIATGTDTVPTFSANSLTGWHTVGTVGSGTWNNAITWASSMYDVDNRVYVAALDTAGNASSPVLVAWVNPDSAAPDIKVTDNSSSYTTSSASTVYTNTSVTVSGMISEPNLTDFTVTATKDGSARNGTAAGVTDITAGSQGSSGNTLVSFTVASFAAVTAKDWSFTIPATAANSGKWVFTITANDAAGYSTNRTIYTTLDAEAPTFSVTKLGSTLLSDTDALKGGNAASVTEYAIKDNVYQIKGSVSDSGGSSLAGMYYYLGTSAPVGGTAFAPDTASGWISCPIVTSSGTSTWTANIDLSDAGISADTTYGVYLAAKDGAGNVSLISANPCAKVSVIPDNAIPKLDVTSVNSVKKTTLAPYYNTAVTVAGTLTETNLENFSVKSGSGTSVTVDTTPGSGTNQPWQFTIPAANGTYSITITATDKAGQSVTKTLSTTIDITAPSFVNSGETLFKVDKKTYEASDWHNAASLSFSGYYSETGSGIAAVYYWLNSTSTLYTADTATGSFSSSVTTGTACNFNTTISGFKTGTNKIYFAALDNAGNMSSLFDASIQVDTDVPSIDTSYTDSLLTNGKTDKTFTGTTKDSTSGVSSISVTLDSYTITNTSGSEYGSIVLSDSNTKWTLELKTALLAKLSGTVSVYATVTDTAGNVSSKTKVCALLVDTKSPIAVVTSPTVEAAASSTLNGVKTITGTVAEANSPKSIALYYSTSAGTSLSDWKLYKTITTEAGTDTDTTAYNASVSSIYNWSFAGFDFTTLSGAASSSTGKATLYLLPVAYDAAGNCSADDGDIKPYDSKESTDPDYSGYSGYYTYTVDQDADRPVITLLNLDLKDMSSSSYVWLKSTDTLYGSVTDDDGISSMQVGYKYAGDTAFTTDTVSLSGGSWSYKLPKGDGAYVLKFIVKDNTSGSAFTTTDGVSEMTSLLQTPKVTDGTHLFGYTMTASDTLIYLKNDTTAPGVTVEGVSTNAGTSWSTAYNSLLLGGTTKSFELRVKATDNNGIKKVEATTSGLTDSDGKPIGQTSQAVFDSVTGYYVFSAISSENGTGSMTVKVTVTDNANLPSVASLSLAVDNTHPVITVLSPDSSTTSSGDITVYGSVDSSSTLYYALSTDGIKSPDKDSNVTSWTDDKGVSTTITDISAKTVYKPMNGAALSWYVYFDGDTDISKTTTHDETLNTWLGESKFNITTADAIKNNEFTAVVKLYVWVKAVDTAGNVTETAHPVLLDPQGGRPTLSIGYPDFNGTTVGGIIKLYGSAEDNNAVNTVWVQIISSQHTYTAGTSYGTSFGTLAYDSSYTATTFTPTADDLDYLAAAGYSVYNIKSYTKDSTAWVAGSSTLADGETAADYGILASFSGSSWNLKINNNGEFDPASDSTNVVGLRVYALDGDKNMSIAADRVVTFDADNPVISNLYLVQSSDSSLPTANTASREYEEDMYVKGTWYLTGTIADDDAIKTLTIGTDKLVLEKATQSGSTWDVSTSDDYKTVSFKYKLDTSAGVGRIGILITVEDNASNKTHTTTQSIAVNYDNVAPELIGSTDSDFNISPSVTQSNNFYTFGSQVKEPASGSVNQSGFKRLAFYFVRRNTTTGTESDSVYDPMLVKSAEKNSNAITGITASTTTTTNGGIVYDSGLYWKYENVTRDSGNLSVLTLSGGSDANIHTGGLVKIGGAIYTIKAVSDSEITIDGNPAGSYKTAYFALALIVDNTTTESERGALQDDGYYASPLNDDGDRMIEGVKKSGTTWTWEANICSKNIPDGPIEIHYVAFDAAGNYSIGVVGNVEQTTYTGYGTADVSDTIYIYTWDAANPAFVSNNAPRLAGVQVGTDLNSNNSIDSDEWNTTYAAAEISADYKTGNIYNIKKLKSVLTLGDSTTPLLTTKGYTEINPEIVGGNGALYYDYSISDLFGTIKLSGENKTSLGSGSADNTLPNLKHIKLQIGDLLKVSDTSNEKFTFRIWDSTDSTKQFASQCASINLYMGVALTDSIEPTAKIQPFYWNSSSDNSLYETKSDNGHIECTSTPAVSGKIVMKGTAHDNKLLSALYMSIPNMNSEFGTGKANLTSLSEGGITYYKMAAYSPSTGEWTGTNYWADYGFDFEVPKSSNSFTSNGHDVAWTLTWDTSMITDAAASGVDVQVLAEDKGTPTSMESGSTTTYLSVDGSTYYSVPAYPANGKYSPASNYKMDVVPYIKNITRNTKYNTNRARTGAYPLLRGETSCTLTGFNLGTKDSKRVFNINSAADGSGTAYSIETFAITKDNTAMSFTVPATARDGYLFMSVSDVGIRNNMNDNTVKSNIESVVGNDNSTYWTDDRYIHVWQSNDADYFDGSTTPIYPAMSMDTKGTLYASFSNYSDAAVYYSTMEVGSSQKVFYTYDPPEETDIVATGTGIVNVLYSANYQGGTSTSWQPNSNDAGGLYLYDKQASKPYVGRSADYNVDRFELFYHNKMLQQFKNFRVKRSSPDNTGIVHVAYYDRITNSIHYSEVASNYKYDSDLDYYNSQTTNEISWVNIDGGSDDDDTLTPSTPHSSKLSGTNVVLSDSRFTGKGRCSGTGETLGLALTLSGYPVIVYYDADNSVLKLARANSLTPKGDETTWTVQNVVSGMMADYITAEIDSSGYLHIAFQNSKNQLVYIKSSNNPSNGTEAYTFNDPVIVADSAAYIDIAFNGTTPYISFLSNINSYDGMNLAYHDSTLKGGWEVMTAPLNYKVTSVRSCVEVHPSPSTASWEAAVGFTPGDKYRAAFFVGTGSGH